MSVQKYRVGHESSAGATKGEQRTDADARTRYEDFASVGPGSLAGRLLRMHWQPVYVSEKLKPGRPVRLRILNEDFTLYRGASGAAHIVGARCPHRGLLLSTGRVSGENLECFYHGWAFDGAGHCVAH